MSKPPTIAESASRVLAEFSKAHGVLTPRQLQTMSCAEVASISEWLRRAASSVQDLENEATGREMSAQPRVRKWDVDETTSLVVRPGQESLYVFQTGGTMLMLDQTAAYALASFLPVAASFLGTEGKDAP